MSNKINQTYYRFKNKFKSNKQKKKIEKNILSKENKVFDGFHLFPLKLEKKVINFVP